MQAVKFVLPVYFLTKLIFTEAVSMGHTIFNAYVIGDHV